MPILSREYERVVSLRSLGILDTEADPQLDELVRTAAHDLRMPIARLNLINADREWTKSAFGYPCGVSIPREQAFCSHVIFAPDEVTIIKDASRDQRFVANPLVNGHLGIRFYAGAPLIDAQGHVLGALSVMDTRPGNLDVLQEARLCSLARFASSLIQSARPVAPLTGCDEHYRNAVNLSPHIPWTAQPDGAVEEAGPMWQELTGTPTGSARGSGWTAALHPDDVQATTDHWHACLRTGHPVDLEYRLKTAAGPYRWFRARAKAQRHWTGNIVRWFGTLEDIHDRKLAITALQESKRVLRAALAVGGLGAWEYDAAHGHVTASELCAKAFGLDHSTDRFDYAAVQAALHPEDRNLLNQERDKLVAGAAAMDIELRTIWADGSLHWVRLTGRTTLDSNGKRRKAVGLAVDITEKRLAQEERERSQATMLHLLRHDALTNLPNRQYLDAKLIEALAAASPGSKVALICIDVDEFKIINQSVGNEAGDDLLCQLAERLRGCSRDSDTVARTGGDEFAILVADTYAVSELVFFVQRLLSVIAAPFALEGGTVSLGVSVAPDDATDAGELRSNAYTALLLAKTSGRGTYRFFEKDLHLRLQAKKALRAGLHDAFYGEQLRLLYQPLVDLPTRRVTAFEALMRWEHPVRGSISPEEFIPVAEESGWIYRFGLWALREACTQAARWPEGINVAVNLSVMQFTSGKLQDDVARVLAETGLAPSRLELEVTESLLLQDSRTNMLILEGLRRLGVKLVMDDFGTGYSSLAYLRRFRFDKIKIDRSLVIGLPDLDGGDAIVRAIFGLGRSLGIDVTAEGVESAEQLILLEDNCCVQAQGFLFSLPVTIDDVPALIGKAF